MPPAYRALGFDIATLVRPRDRRPRPAGPSIPSDRLSAVGLDELVEQITVDAYGDEAYWSFLKAFEDEVAFPFQAALVGMTIEVTGVDFDGNERRGLVAQVQRGDHRSTVSIVDIELPETGTPASVTLAAYQRWLGLT